MTSIEFLEKQYNENGKLTAVDFYQAKQIHKAETIDAYEQGSDDEIVAFDGTRKYKHGVEYYTSTYGSKGNDEHKEKLKELYPDAYSILGEVLYKKD